jgi:DNA-binding transcriptional ArsR family regulator
LSLLEIIIPVSAEERDADEQEIVTVLQALGEPTRWRAVQLLSDSPRRAGQLSEALGVSAPTMSKHLRILLGAGVVTDERPPEDARARVFRLSEERMVALRARLDQLQAQWDEQLASFSSHVRKKAKR